ncbi:hypothetical protein LG201_08715 [Methylobacillus gramineus]|uniref:hypothetical protein n=1 Tax=Methylobacillus gramineus TaxID=755169 RepID=UPI001CFFBC87|nr:hypothetical protein [Methylobacillus gramineus]MCB5185284.1 hypothetical protein [Methylobacillus gramineus]
MSPVRNSDSSLDDAVTSERSSVSAWEQSIKQGNQAFSQNEDQAALQQYHSALKQAEQLLKQCVQADTLPLPVDTVMAAYVVSHHNLANVHARQGDINAAACRLCEAHQCLSRICADASMGCELRQAAQRHGRRTYTELLNFSNLYSQHPLVTKTLRVCGQFCTQQERSLH